ncbi:MAG: V-type ATPase 116kDa subunit family protein [Candidatus Micrarchaeia archaeon]
MLKAVKMSKIRAICLKAIAPQVVKSLHTMSVLHITDSELPEIERAGPLASYDEVAKRLVKIRALREALPKNGRLPKKKQAYESPLEEADALLEKSEEVFSLVSEKEAVAKELDTNLASQKALSEIEGLDVDFSELASGTLQFSLVRIPKEKVKLAREVLAATKNCDCTVSEADGGKAAIALVAIKKGQDAKFLEGLGSVLAMPQIQSTPKEEIAALKEGEARLREKMEAAERKFAKAADTICPQAASLEEALSIEADRAHIATSFGASASLYFIEGWAEASKVGEITAELSKKFGRKLYISQAPQADHDAPPTLLDNPEQVKPFEYLVGFVSLPKYTEIDPSIFLAITIPLMYALILGDAGYATCSLLLSIWIVKSTKRGSFMNQIGMVWVISSIPAILAGIVFDEYFGFTHTHLASLVGFEHVQIYQGFHRLAEINTLMLISLLVGMAHLSLGFIIGAVNEWHHSRKHAYAKICWLLILLSGFMAIASGMYGIMPSMAIPSAAVLALSILGVVAMEGVIAAIEIPGLLGNVMSYLRIAAVGVGGVIIAEAINELLMPHFELSVAGIVLFAITAVLYLSMHMAACMLVMFEGIVHGARLNVVEFFGKFYQGGGVLFAPFSARRNYTQED